MAKGLIDRSTLTAIADAIRAKTETTDTMLPSEMAGLIEAIKTGVEFPSWLEVNEIEFAQVKPTSESTTIAVPCGFSDVPLYHLIYCTGSFSGSFTATGMSGEMRLPGYVFYDTNTDQTRYTGCYAKSLLTSSANYIVFSEPSAGTWSLSNGIATLTSPSTSYKYRTIVTYNIIMWR